MPAPESSSSPPQRVRFFRFSAPQEFYWLAGKMAPWFAAVAAILAVIGLYIGFFVAPVDAVQGQVYRIIFIHVPVAWMAMFIYLVMAFWSLVGLTLKTRLSFLMSQALAPTGAIFCFVSLWTGAFWGRPTWGTYWVWDARLTSQLFLLFIYFGFMTLHKAIDNPRRADMATAVYSLVSSLIVPVIYFSVQWWSTLHQGASVSTKGSSMNSSMLMGMLLMVFAVWSYTIAACLWRVRTLILERERHTAWVSALIVGAPAPQQKPGEQ